MAKVMVSMPDDLLARVDAEARRIGSTRSAVLRGFAELALEQHALRGFRTRRALLDDNPALIGSRGGNAAALVKRSRPQ